MRYFNALINNFGGGGVSGCACLCVCVEWVGAWVG